MPTFRNTKTGQTVRFFDRLAIGRAPENDLVLEDGRISGSHALLAFQGGRYRIMDLNSHNGTTVDGVRISRWVDLVEGSTLIFGPCGPFVLEELAPPEEAGEERDAPTLAATNVDGQFRPTRLVLYSKDLTAGTILVEQGGARCEFEGSMRFLLLYVLASELLDEPRDTPEPNRGWIPDERLRIKLWGLRGSERRDPSSLGKLIHDTRAMMRRKGVEAGFVEKRKGATRLSLLPSQVELHTP